MTNFSLKMLAKEWQTKKAMGEAVEKGEEEEVEFDVGADDASCPCDCEMSLRYALFC